MSNAVVRDSVNGKHPSKWKIKFHTKIEVRRHDAALLKIRVSPGTQQPHSLAARTFPHGDTRALVNIKSQEDLNLHFKHVNKKNICILFHLEKTKNTKT